MTYSISKISSQDLLYEFWKSITKFFRKVKVPVFIEGKFLEANLIEYKFSEGHPHNSKSNYNNSLIYLHI